MQLRASTPATHDDELCHHLHYDVVEIKSDKEGRVSFENVSGLSGVLVPAQAPISLLLLLSLS